MMTTRIPQFTVLEFTFEYVYIISNRMTRFALFGYILTTVMPLEPKHHRLK